MPKGAKKTTTKKRTTLKNLTTKTKAISQKDSKRVKGGRQGQLPNSLTINGVSLK